MKWIEWIIAASLVVIGLSCLTMSATSMLHPESIRAYLQIFFQICLWAGVPLVVVGIGYLLIKKKKG